MDRVAGFRSMLSTYTFLPPRIYVLLLRPRKGTFREDFYDRLNVFPITTPPIRRRPADRQLVVEYFIALFVVIVRCSRRGNSEFLKNAGLFCPVISGSRAPCWSRLHSLTYGLRLFFSASISFEKSLLSCSEAWPVPPLDNAMIQYIKTC